MADVREQILVRLFELIGCEVDGIRYAKRNIPSLDDDASVILPAFVLLDGDEIAIDDEPWKRPSMVPRRFEMSPLAWIAFSEKAEHLGTDLNTLRTRIIKAVLGDVELLSLVDRNGIRYDGMESPRSETGRLILGQRNLRFTFTYLLIPAEL